MAAGAHAQMRLSVSRASTSVPSRQPGPACSCTQSPVGTSPVALTAESSRSGTGGGRSGSMTCPVSADPCGCCGPSGSGNVRTVTARGRRSPRSTSWPCHGRNSRPEPPGGQPMVCSVSTPRSRPWPTNSAFLGTRRGTPSGQKLPEASVSPVQSFCPVFPYRLSRLVTDLGTSPEFPSALILLVAPVTVVPVVNKHDINDSSDR